MILQVVASCRNLLCCKSTFHIPLKKVKFGDRYSVDAPTARTIQGQGVGGRNVMEAHVKDVAHVEQLQLDQHDGEKIRLHWLWS